MEELKNYLLEHNFEKRLQKLKNKLKNKTVLVYGTGKLFQVIVSNYDLSGLNIIGISDRKYLVEDEGKEDFGYKIVPYNKFNLMNVDYILLATQNYKSLLKMYQSRTMAKKIIPLVSYNLKETLIYNLKKIPVVERYINRKNNVFVLIKKNGKKIYNPRIKNLKVNFWGKNSYVEIHEPFRMLERGYISCGDESKIIIKPFNFHKRLRVLIGDRNQLVIGQNTTVEGLTIHQFNSNNTKVELGDDCQIAYRVSIKTSDIHSIYDKNTKKLLNYAKDVTLGNHVWIAADTTILKGSNIPNNCMVGACSLVNKSFSEENSIIAGSPAKVIKQGINWDRRGVDSFPHD